MKYHKALERTHRFVPEIYEKDKRNIENLLDLQSRIQEGMNASYDLVVDGPMAEALSNRSKSVFFTWPLFEVKILDR